MLKNLRCSECGEPAVGNALNGAAPAWILTDGRCFSICQCRCAAHLAKHGSQPHPRDVVCTIVEAEASLRGDCCSAVRQTMRTYISVLGAQTVIDLATDALREEARVQREEDLAEAARRAAEKNLARQIAAERKLQQFMDKTGEDYPILKELRGWAHAMNELADHVTGTGAAQTGEAIRLTDDIFLRLQGELVPIELIIHTIRTLGAGSSITALQVDVLSGEYRRVLRDILRKP